MLLSNNLRNSLRENQTATRDRQEYSEDDGALDDLCRRCHNVAEKLLVRLNKLKIRSPHHRSWESFKNAFRASWSHEEIDSLTSKMIELRGEIEFRILLSFRGSIQALATQQSRASYQLTESTKTIISTFLNTRDEFANELQRQAEKLAELQVSKKRGDAQMHGTLQTVRHQEELKSENPVSRDITIREAEIEQHMILLMIENGILESLDFPSILDRYEDVEIAHNRTFQWMYQEPEDGNQSWSNFVQWLRHGTSLYWISGKAGSGKSTLMKYVCDNPQTREELRVWATTSPCDVSGFFFWNSGSEEQRSQRGLLRTLLFKTLQNHRQLLPTVLADAWDSWSTKVRSTIRLSTIASNSSFMSYEPRPWTLQQLMHAFRRLILQCRSADIKLCFFIDGLDEYMGDHDDIVEYFLQFSQERGVKICLSSRPLLVFEEGFTNFPGLKLQNLTYSDINYYVEDKLKNHRRMAMLSIKDPNQARHLATEIVTKANGVFLWVKLVVKSLLQGLRDQNRISDLEKRLRHLPADLEALYEHMLERTDPFYLEQSSQIFQIVLVAQKESTNRQITLLGLSWAEDEDESAAISASLRAITTEDVAYRYKLMDNRLKSICSGLLESYDSKYPNIAPNARVVFLHRTVSDFFKKPSVWDKITQHTNGTRFSPHLSLLRSCILQIKGLKLDHSEPLDMTIIRDALNYAKKAEDDLDEGFPALLDHLDAAATYQWRMSGARGVNGRVKKKATDLELLGGSSKVSKRPFISDYQEFTDSDSEVVSDYSGDEASDEELAKDKTYILDRQQEFLLPPKQPINQHINEGHNAPSIMSKSIPIAARRNENIAEYSKFFITRGVFHNWTYGIEFPGVKPLKRVVPFYDLAGGLGLQHYVANKNETGLVVDHDINHHLLMHAVTCHSRKHGQSQVPDPAVIQYALQAGADPNFSLHGRTPWQQALMSAQAHLSSETINGEAHDRNTTLNRQWVVGAGAWAKIIKIFLQHGADSEALRRRHLGKAWQNALASAENFPEKLRVEAEEIKSSITALVVMLTLRLHIHDLPEREEISASSGSVLSNFPTNDNTSYQSAPGPLKSYNWVLSWLSIGRGGKGGKS